MTTIQTNFTIIGKDKDSFIESYVGEPLVQDPESGKKEEHFFIVVELLHKFLEGETIAEAITETFRKTFYQTEQEDNFTRFEEALKAVNATIGQMESEAGLVLKNINVAIAAIIRDELFISQANDAEVYLIRRGQCSIISDGLSDGQAQSGQDLFQNISSGSLKNGDTVLLATGRLLRYISKAELGRNFLGLDIATAIENVTESLTTEVLGRIGVLAGSYLTEQITVEQNKRMDLKSLVKPDAIGATVKGLVNFFNFIPHGNKKSSQQNILAAGPLEETEKVATNVNEAARPNLKRHKAKNKFISTITQATEKIYGQFSSRFSPKTAKIAFGITTIFVCLFVIFLISRGLQLGGLKEYETVLLEARQQVEEARNKSDKATAATLLANAEQTLKPALSVRYARSEANQILSDIRQIRFQFDNVITVSEPELVANVSESSDKGPILGIINTDSGLFAYNKSELIEILLNSTKAPIKLTDAGTIIKATYLPDSDAIIFLTAANKFLEFRNGITKVIDTSDDKYKPASTIFGFGSRLYVVDNQANQIWKYNRQGDQFGGAEAYIKSSKIPPSKEMAIDGSIYLITENNQIMRYYGGEIKNFVINNAPLLPPQTPSAIYTDFDSSYLYLLDVAESRIMVYFKDQKTNNLEYVSQYHFPTINNIVGFSIDLDIKKLYVADEDSVYATELK